MGRFARKARRGMLGAVDVQKLSQFQINPLAYIQAVRAGLCPYDGTPLTPEQADPEAPAGLKWCAKCERGFGPVESG